MDQPRVPEQFGRNLWKAVAGGAPHRNDGHHECASHFNQWAN
jgi:hypothetical protein